ncbi:hypothetical protein HK102_004586, partial [Quaeritorhiza haematococci]
HHRGRTACGEQSSQPDQDCWLLAQRGSDTPSGALEPGVQKDLPGLGDPRLQI